MALDLTWLVARATRAQVLQTIRDRKHPATADVDQALEDIPGDPLPRELVDYVRRVYLRGGARRPGPTTGRKTGIRDFLVCLDYGMVVNELRGEHQSTEVLALAAKDTAKMHTISPRTVRRIVAAHASAVRRIVAAYASKQAR